MDVLELLLVHMADPMAADHGGCTPTIAAAANGRADVLRRLVELVRRSDGGGGSVDGGDESKLAHVVKAALAAKAAKAADSTALVRWSGCLAITLRHPCASQDDTVATPLHSLGT
jgi:hypothetical protein